jgi:Bacteriophage lambda head decoration protein D
MTTLTETVHAGGFLVSEANGNRSRDAGTLISGQNLVAGAVLGKITLAVAAAPIPTIVGTGTGAMTLLTFGRAIQTGSYVITLLATSATAAFSVTCPDGLAIANGVVGTAYASDHLNFLISSAGTMTIGDTFTVVVTAAGTPVVIGGTGTGTMSAISLGPDAQNGGYRVVLKAVVSHGGDFDVIAPDGELVGRFLMGTTTGASASFTSSHVNFTLTDATDFILGNYFNIIVAKGSGKFTAWAPTTYNGSHIAYGLLYADTNATSGDAICTVIAREAVVNTDEITWPSVTAGVKAVGVTQLAARGIFGR